MTTYTNQRYSQVSKLDDLEDVNLFGSTHTEKTLGLKRSQGTLGEYIPDPVEGSADIGSFDSLTNCEGFDSAIPENYILVKNNVGIYSPTVHKPRRGTLDTLKNVVGFDSLEDGNYTFEKTGEDFTPNKLDINYPPEDGDFIIHFEPGDLKKIHFEPAIEELQHLKDVLVSTAEEEIPLVLRRSADNKFVVGELETKVEDLSNFNSGEFEEGVYPRVVVRPGSPKQWVEFPLALRSDADVVVNEDYILENVGKTFGFEINHGSEGQPALLFNINSEKSLVPQNLEDLKNTKNIPPSIQVGPTYGLIKNIDESLGVRLISDAHPITLDELTNVDGFNTQTSVGLPYSFQKDNLNIWRPARAVRMLDDLMDVHPITNFTIGYRVWYREAADDSWVLTSPKLSQLADTNLLNSPFGQVHGFVTTMVEGQKFLNWAPLPDVTQIEFGRGLEKDGNNVFVKSASEQVKVTSEGVSLNLPTLPVFAKQTLRSGFDYIRLAIQLDQTQIPGTKIKAHISGVNKFETCSFTIVGSEVRELTTITSFKTFTQILTTSDEVYLKVKDVFEGDVISVILEHFNDEIFYTPSIIQTNSVPGNPVVKTIPPPDVKTFFNTRVRSEATPANDFDLVNIRYVNTHHPKVQQIKFRVWCTLKSLGSGVYDGKNYKMKGELAAFIPVIQVWSSTEPPIVILEFPPDTPFSNRTLTNWYYHGKVSNYVFGEPIQGYRTLENLRFTVLNDPDLTNLENENFCLEMDFDWD